MIARVTLVEVAAALNRKVREGRFDTVRRDREWRLFGVHCRKQYVVTIVDEITFRQAEQLLCRYRLRAYDAMQIAAALQGQPVAASPATDYRFCTADRVQAEAAELEGLVVELIT
jgi:predicted nucleic acid-binding protein